MATKRPWVVSGLDQIADKQIDPAKPGLWGQRDRLSS